MNRAATETIKGYFYQFDHSILKILQLSEMEDYVTIEGIEDVDIKTIDENIAIQCKYYASTEYNHSVISKPVRLMLNHFKDVKSGLNPEMQYYLYGYYNKGQEKLILPLDIDFLKKNFLTYTKTDKKTKEKKKHEHHLELGLNDEDLLEFLSRLTINNNALSYEEQNEKTLQLLEEKFNCSRFEAEHYYYNNALRVIKELAIKSEISKRKITKKEFIKRIDNRTILFNEWFVIIKGKKKYLESIKNEYFSSLNVRPFERLFLIEIDEDNYKRADLKSLILKIVNKWSKLSRREPSPFCPYIYIHNISEEELINLKLELFSEGHIFLDGFPFKDSPFLAKSICEKPNFTNGIKLKWINNLEYIKSILAETSNTKEIYQFYLKKHFYAQNIESVKHIQIQVDSYVDIKEVI